MRLLICQITDMWNITALMVHCPKQWTTFQISKIDLDPESAKCENVQVLKYHTRFCNGHCSVSENNEQPFKFTVSNSAQKAQLCQHSANHQCRNDIAQCSPMPKKFWFTMVQLYCKVAIMNQDFVVVGPKSARSPSLFPFRFICRK